MMVMVLAQWCCACLGGPGKNSRASLTAYHVPCPSLSSEHHSTTDLSVHEPSNTGAYPGQAQRCCQAVLPVLPLPLPRAPVAESLCGPPLGHG